MWRALKAEAKEGDFRIKVIVYLRRQDMYLISGWNQMVKSGIGRDAATPWKEYISNLDSINKMKYASHLKKLAAFFGKKNLIVRRFDPKRFAGGTIYSDFLQAVGLELTKEYHIKQAAKNTRLAGNTHEIQRVLNGMPGMNAAFHSFFRRALLSYADLSGEYYPCEMFSKAEAETFMKQYEEENREVSEEYFNGEELFDMSWKDVPKWEKDNPQMQDDLILISLLLLIFELIKPCSSFECFLSPFCLPAVILKAPFLRRIPYWHAPRFPGSWRCFPSRSYHCQTVIHLSIY